MMAYRAVGGLRHHPKVQERQPPVLGVLKKRQMGSEGRRFLHIEDSVSVKSSSVSLTEA